MIKTKINQNNSEHSFKQNVFVNFRMIIHDRIGCIIIPIPELLK